MSVTILDGRALSTTLRQGLKQRIQDHNHARAPGEERPPGLAVIVVGDDPASAIYVRNKRRAAQRLGMVSKIIELAASSSEQEILGAVEGLNADPQIDAFLVQLPLPKAIDTRRIALAIDPAKDGDGLHPHNLGRLVCGIDGPKPCTPAGIMALLESLGEDLSGKKAVVVGRSTIVGKPTALLLLARDYTVTLCHSRTVDLAAEVASADILVAAVGQPEVIRGEWIKPGAIVIDVGINRLEVQGGDVVSRLVGDVEFDEACKRARAITPVPGGVGPMTITMLLENAVSAWERATA